MTKNTQQAVSYLVFTLVGVAVVLWQLLLPGYVLVLDWGVGPINTLPYHDITRFVQFPSHALTYLLGLVLPMWVVQKILLAAVVGALFALPLVFYPWAKSAGAEYLAALLAVFNPFVYERLLAGQWRVLAGYALLFPLFYFLVGFAREQSWRNTLGIFGTLLLIGCWSIHFLALGSVITIVYLAVFAWRHSCGQSVDTWKKLLLGALGAAAVSLYWIVPLVLRGSQELQTFGAEHFFAFATARDPLLGALPHVLTLHGFWAEAHAWGEQFVLAKDVPLLFYPVLLGVLGVVVYGARASHAHRRTRFATTFLLISLCLSAVFAAGVSAYGIWPINAWLLEHVPFWNGFRDTHKWAAVIALVYALWYGAGATKLMARASRPTLAFAGLALLPILLTPQLLFGLNGQMSPTWHPAAWHEVDSILAEEPDCTAIFLPWHQYYASEWNNDQLTITPGKSFFDCAIISGHNTDLGDLTDQPTTRADYPALAAAITNNSPVPMRQTETIATLRAAGVTHIIFATDLTDSDIYTYPWLAQSAVEEVFASPEITLYRLLE